jgi:hypothetical protein
MAFWPAGFAVRKQQHSIRTTDPAASARIIGYVLVNPTHVTRHETNVAPTTTVLAYNACHLTSSKVTLNALTLKLALERRGILIEENLTFSTMLVPFNASPTLQSRFPITLT